LLPAINCMQNKYHIPSGPRDETYTIAVQPNLDIARCHIKGRAVLEGLEVSCTMSASHTRTIPL